MYEKFHNDRLINDRSLGNRKSDNKNKNKKKKKKKKKNNNNNVRSTWTRRPVSRSNNNVVHYFHQDVLRSDVLLVGWLVGWFIRSFIDVFVSAFMCSLLCFWGRISRNS